MRLRRRGLPTPGLEEGLHIIEFHKNNLEALCIYINHILEKEEMIIFSISSLSRCLFILQMASHSVPE